jgi:hypothetical protein
VSEHQIAAGSAGSGKLAGDDPDQYHRWLLVSGVVQLGDARWDSSAVADCDALVFGPRPDTTAALTSGAGTAWLTAMPASSLTGVLDKRRELPVELGGILGAQIDFVLRAAEPELQGLIGGASVQVIFQDDRNPCCHRDLP